eukprot:TRINITY_DN4858_c0_g1_i1.p1 TRINITY_DN4858_c0_g1~~TRINITY_DN4858_c0_g1_i1.p1  ORF type:complete len:206 (-),score=12.40 TRINITY_DN4858_c0_g1_i1:268-885(-)
MAHSIVLSGLQVTPQNVEKSSKAIEKQIRREGCSLKLVRKLKRGEYHMYITHVSYIDPFMFYCAIEQNNECKALPEAEKIGFGWVPVNNLLKLSKKKKRKTKSNVIVNKTKQIRIFLPPGLNSMYLRCKDPSSILLHPCFRTSLVRISKGGKLRRFLKQQQISLLKYNGENTISDFDNSSRSLDQDVTLTHKHLLYWVELINQPV